MTSIDPKLPSSGQRALMAGDMLDPYIEAALEFMPESRVMDILKTCGAEGLSSLKDFRRLLTGEINFPYRLFGDIGTNLIKAGLPQERIFNYMHIRKLPRRTLAKMNAVIFTKLSQQKFGREVLDVVCCSMTAASAYDPYISNAILSDCIIEKRDGDLRKARLIGATLAPAEICWFWLNHLKWCAVYCPTNVGEPKAETKVVQGSFKVIDPHYPDLPLLLPIKPSLTEVAREHRLEMAERDGMVYLNGQTVATRDDCPVRMMDGFYRMIQDVRIENGRVVIEKPRSEVRPYHSLLLASDCRYHLSQSFPVYEIEAEFNVSRLRQWLISTAVISSRIVWGTLLRNGTNPWMQLFHLLEKPSAPRQEQEIDRYFRSYCQPQFTSAELSLPAKLEYYKVQFGLSPREREVLEKIVMGKSNGEIAAEFKITDLTVKSHVSNILSKTGFPSRHKLTASLIDS